MPKPATIRKRTVTLVLGILVAIFITLVTLGAVSNSSDDTNASVEEQSIEPAPKAYLETAGQYAYRFFVFVNTVKERQ